MTSQCSLCGTVVALSALTEEHFLPRWISRAVAETPNIQLANDTAIRAGQLRVPACESCNARFGQTEERLSRGFRSPDGPLAFVSRAELSAWAAKVLWGFAVLENSLPANRRAGPASDPILPDEYRDLLSHLRDYVQSWSKGEDVDPASAFVFRAQAEPGDDFGYVDDPQAGVLGVRIGQWALIVCVADHCDQASLKREDYLSLGYLPVFTDLGSLELGPIQFSETCTWAFTVQRSRPPFPPKGHAFGYFDAEDHSEHLFWSLRRYGYNREQLLWPKTFLFNSDMSPRFVSLAATREWATLRRKGEL